MNKQLPLSEPPVRCFQHDAYPLSIMANRNDYLHWFYSNYIQLCCHKDIIKERRLFLEFYEFRSAINSPWLKVQRMYWDTLSQGEFDILTFIIEQINAGYYYFGFVDEYYIPERKAYQNAHNSHDILIYGYDLDENTFNIMGYNEQFMLCYSKVKFEEFETAYRHNTLDKDEFWWTNDIYFMKYNEKASYNFDLLLVSQLLQDYYFSQNSSERYRRYHNPLETKIYGMKTYDHLKLYLELLLDNKIWFDMTALYLLTEHKQCMIGRIRYMEKRGFIFDSNRICNGFQDLFNKANTALNLFIKYGVTANKSVLERVMKIADLIAANEKLLVAELLEKMELRDGAG